jgi:hypothetical protein
VIPLEQPAIVVSVGPKIGQPVTLKQVDVATGMEQIDAAGAGESINDPERFLGPCAFA